MRHMDVHLMFELIIDSLILNRSNKEERVVGICPFLNITKTQFPSKVF